MDVTSLRSFRGACAAAALLASTACAIFGPDERVVVMDIAPQRVACHGTSGLQECLSVRQHPDTGWTFFYDEIAGFQFEPGFEYTLVVAVRSVSNPPADGSSLSYRLLEIRRKVPAS